MTPVRFIFQVRRRRWRRKLELEKIEWRRRCRRLRRSRRSRRRRSRKQWW